MDHSSLDRRRFLAAAVLLSATGGRAAAQVSTEREIAPLALPEDRPGTWTLHFRYKEPRILNVTVPGKGPQTIWYMWFQVYNKTGEPQTFLPEFELVTRNPATTMLDEPRPFAVDAVRRIENPNGEANTPEPLRIHTTISIAKRPIPPTKPDSVPRTVSGVAIWTDMATKAPKNNKFSIYVSGLSDGLTTTALPSGETLIKRKTLELDFLKPTDENRVAITDIRLDNSVVSPEKWLYRASSKLKPGGVAPPPAGN